MTKPTWPPSRPEPTESTADHAGRMGEARMSRRFRFTATCPAQPVLRRHPIMGFFGPPLVFRRAFVTPPIVGLPLRRRSVEDDQRLSAQLRPSGRADSTL